MNPLKESIKFTKAKNNHFYAIKSGGKYLKIKPKIGDIVYEVPVVSGGSDEKRPLLLEIPLPLCDKHQHSGNPFAVKTCNGWEYIVIPTPLGSLRCRECSNELFLPMPFLCGANLSGASLVRASLVYANLSGANLVCANLRGANLRDANLVHADLSDANLVHADLSDASLVYADLSGADLRDANLVHANLSGANLVCADLSGANLVCANLVHANLSGADLSDADLSGANLRDANLVHAINIKKSINIDKAYWNKFTEIDKEFKKLLNKERFLE